MITDFNVRIVCVPVSGNPAWEYHEVVQTDKFDDTITCPAHQDPGDTVRDFVIKHTTINVPTCVGNSPSDLTIRTNVGSAIVDDDTLVTAHSTLKKFVLISLLRVTATQALEIFSREKTDGEYVGIPAGKVLEQDYKEFSVVAAGTVLVEENSWI